jgi:hypothetical protein
MTNINPISLRYTGKEGKAIQGKQNKTKNHNRQQQKKQININN